MASNVSVIIPTLHEERAIEETIRAVADLRDGIDIVVVDGGSADRTCEIVRDLQNEFAGLRLIENAQRGRGIQQATGAEAARGDVLWFLHADTVPDPGALAAIDAALSADRRISGGNFALRFTGSSSGARFLNRVYPWLRWLRLYYGDSGIFVRREAYLAAGGFNPHPIFEDLDFIERLNRTGGRFVHLEVAVTTSSRRFENRVFAGMFAHWTLLQILYWIGVPPARLVRWYAAVR